MPSWLAELPFAVLYLALFCGAMARGQMIYWLGRFATQRGSQSTRGGLPRVRAWLSRERIARGIDLVRRWGWPAVPLAYLTVGIQSAVMAAAGVIGMRWWIFTSAQVPGGLAWALIYSTIGWLAWEAALLAAVSSPVGAASCLLTAIALVIALVLLNRRLR